jgi:hypothetical protein
MFVSAVATASLKVISGYRASCITRAKANGRLKLSRPLESERFRVSVLSVAGVYRAGLSQIGDFSGVLTTALRSTAVGAVVLGCSSAAGFRLLTLAAGTRGAC